MLNSGLFLNVSDEAVLYLSEKMSFFIQKIKHFFMTVSGIVSSILFSTRRWLLESYSFPSFFLSFMSFV